jgi:hypothetical protein
MVPIERSVRVYFLYSGERSFFRQPTDRPPALFYISPLVDSENSVNKLRTTAAFEDEAATFSIFRKTIVVFIKY